jgi:2-iminobutanoate/2-iminopropanoate deaminase
MSKHAISSPAAPKAVGPYSQGIRTGDFIFLAGQIPIDPATGELVPGDVTAQTRRCLENIKALLAAEGATPANVVKATVFLTDLANFAAMNAVYAEYFTELPPARSTIQVAGLPKAAMVEIEVIARTA